MCIVGKEGNFTKENCATQNYTSCVTIKTQGHVDNTSSSSIEKKCGFSMNYSVGGNNETLDEDDIEVLYGGISKQDFFGLENGCKYLNETNTNVCRCLSNFCNTGSSMKNIYTIYFLLITFTIVLFFDANNQ